MTTSTIYIEEETKFPLMSFTAVVVLSCRCAYLTSKPQFTLSFLTGWPKK